MSKITIIIIVILAISPFLSLYRGYLLYNLRMKLNNGETINILEYWKKHYSPVLSFFFVLPIKINDKWDLGYKNIGLRINSLSYLLIILESILISLIVHNFYLKYA